jgi:hypothetical protein
LRRSWPVERRREYVTAIADGEFGGTGIALGHPSLDGFHDFEDRTRLPLRADADYQRTDFMI